MSSDRTATLIRHTGLYALGTFGSKFLMFLLVPLYSFYVATDSFGYYDLCLSMALLLFPLISMQMREGALRFLLEADTEEKRREVVSFIVLRTVLNSVIFALLALAINLIHPVPYLLPTLLLAVSMALFEVGLQICRGLNFNVAFASAGVINAGLILVVSLGLLFIWDLGIMALFAGNIAGRLGALLYMQLRTKVFSRYLTVRHRVDRATSRAILRYCMPMIAVTLLTWTINYSNRYFVSYFCGLDEMGLFAVAQKWAQIFEAFAAVLFMGWQELAMKHFHDADHNSYFSRILNMYVWFYTFAVVGISFVVKFAYPWLVGAEYQDGVNFVFPAVMALAIGYIAYFYEVAYQCEKNTLRSLVSWTFSAVVAVVCNLVFGYLWGAYGILAASVAAFLALAVYRAIDTRRYMELRWSGRSVMCVAMMAVSLVAFYIPLPQYFSLGWIGITLAAYGALMPPFALTFIKSKLKKEDAAEALESDALLDD